MQVNVFGKERFKTPELAETESGISLDTHCKDCGSNKLDAKGYCKKCGGFGHQPKETTEYFSEEHMLANN